MTLIGYVIFTVGALIIVFIAPVIIWLCEKDVRKVNLNDLKFNVPPSPPLLKQKRVKKPKEFLLEVDNGYIAGDYVPDQVYELMESYAKYYHKEKFKIKSHKLMR